MPRFVEGSRTMKAPISLQLYTLREACKTDFRAVLKEVADIGFVGVEPAGYYGLPPAEFGKIVRDLGLVISSAHGGFPTGSQTEAVLDEHEQLGNTFIISGFGRNGLNTEEDVRKAAALIAEGAENAAKRGMRVGLHNHEFEFLKRFNGRTAYSLLTELSGPAAFNQLDVYWAQTAGEDPAAIIRENPARFPLLHIKDGPCVMGEPMTALGQGEVDVPAVLEAATAVEWHVIELDACATDMMEAVRESYRYMVENGYSTGRK
ncbi:MAG TPA: sugar phosphate isomerase/epimerase [Chthoniobacterales bacterium]|jgi:sugar phosphate isomerase/epimerase